MTDLKTLLKELIAIPGLSGYEAPILQLVERSWGPLTDELQVSRLGSLHGLRKGTGAEPRPSLLLAAHMDAIGLIVSGLVDGFLRVTEVGGVDGRVLPGQLVTVHGREDMPGVIVLPPSHLLPPEYKGKPVPVDYLLVDVGLEPQEVEHKARIGDLVSFAQPPLEMGDGFLAGHSLDNRASVAALTCCLEALQGRKVLWDIWAVATVQEEETMAGAATSAFQIRPTLAVAIDVTFGRGAGSPKHKTYPLDGGPTLGWGPNIHPGLHKAFKELAERLEIPWGLEVMPHGSGTDAVALQVTAEGIPTMVLSIPLRYMHTPVELVSIKDIERTGRLLAEFAAQLDADFMNSLTWDT
jgi:endoglucanase